MVTVVVCEIFVGHTQIVALLLDSKADYASSDANGATPLHYAAQNNLAVSRMAQP